MRAFVITSSLLALAVCMNLGCSDAASDPTGTPAKRGGAAPGASSGTSDGATGGTDSTGGAGTPGSTDPPPATGTSDVDAGAPSPGTPTGPAGSGKGYLHTSGALLLDDAGTKVRLTGVNWFGFETSNFAPHGLWARSMDSMLDQMKTLGFNSIRIPYTNQMFDAGSTPNGIDFGKNPDLKGLTALQILDKLVAGAAARGLRVVLDRHRPDASGQSPLWYTAGTSEQRWIDDWKMLATHFKGNPTVFAFDLHNEPHGDASWGDGNQATDWRLAAERAGNAVLGVNPDLLIIVEGVEKTMNTFGWWGGNLRGAASAPVRLAVANRLVYSPHEYPASVSNQPWFADPTYPNNMPALWDAEWGDLAKKGTAPVWIGEFGTKNETAVDQTWLKSLVGYVGDRQLNFAFWCWNPDSGDTGGILKDDWQTVDDAKMAVLKAALAK